MSDGYSIDAQKEILPGVMTAIGVQLGEGAAWDLIQRLLTMCSSLSQIPALALRNSLPVQARGVAL